MVLTQREHFTRFPSPSPCLPGHGQQPHSYVFGRGEGRARGGRADEQGGRGGLKNLQPPLSSDLGRERDGWVW